MLIKKSFKIMLLSPKESKPSRAVVTTTTLAKNLLQIVFSLILVLSLTILEASSQSEKNSKLEATIRRSSDGSSLTDPIVWDSSSLYKRANLSINQLHIPARTKRATTNSVPEQQQLVDACQSKMEVLTPYHATNSKGKLRTIVNTELMQQAIQVEICTRSSSASQSYAKCGAQPDCGCEQKYKWHRLLVLDPHDSSGARGLFMDWFLFPSSCVCRCKVNSPISIRKLIG